VKNFTTYFPKQKSLTMKKLKNLIFIFLMVPALVIVSCSKDDDDNGGDQPQEQAGFPILSDYLVDNNMDLTDILNGWITTAENINAKGTDDYFIIDIRSADDYAAGHIPGAVNSTLDNVLEVAKDATKPIVVACYTGQTAGHAVCALRLSGYTDAKVLMWGMCSWNSVFSENFTKYWPAAVGDKAADFPGSWQLPADITPSQDMGAYPDWTTSSTAGAEVLAERVDALLDNGFNAKPNTDVLENFNNYFINNFWDLADTEHYGNVTGSYRIKPLTLAADEFKYLDPSKPVVTYCWTGQTSSMITAYLYVLGYDAYSLTYGTNGMIYSDLESHKWTDAACMEYAYETK
jgi:rhodanese-related sulfurtransferase